MDRPEYSLPTDSVPDSARHPAHEGSELTAASFGANTSIEGVVLYRLSEPQAIPADASPAPRCDLLRHADMDGIVRLLMLFRLPPLRQARRPSNGYAVWITRDTAFIPIGAGIAPMQICSLGQLIALLPSIHDWLSAWSCSPERMPSPTPDWAEALKLQDRVVEAIACGIVRSLARTSGFELTIRDMHGDEATITIPAKSRLGRPPGPVNAPTKRIHVSAVEDIRIGYTPGGNKVLLVGDSSALHKRRSFRLRPSDLRRARVRVPRHLSRHAIEANSQEEE